MQKLYLNLQVLSLYVLQIWHELCLFQPFFDKLIKRKWLISTDAFEAIEANIKQHFKKFRRMDPPPYQVIGVCLKCVGLSLVDVQV